MDLWCFHCIAFVEVYSRHFLANFQYVISNSNIKTSSLYIYHFSTVVAFSSHHHQNFLFVKSGETLWVILIETSHSSCPIRFEQPTKFLGPSSCVSCSRFGSLTFQSTESVDRLIVEQLFYLTLGMTPNGSCSCSIMFI